MSAAIIAAVARNGVIGVNGGLPWRISSDLKRFKALTLGHTLVMGRSTFESIGRPLPGRKTVVLTRNPRWSADGVEVVHGLDQALDREGEVFIAGGAQIYALAMPRVDQMHLSWVDATPPGDTWFPAFDGGQWGVEQVRTITAGPRDAHAHTYFHLIRPRGERTPASLTIERGAEHL